MTLIRRCFLAAVLIGLAAAPVLSLPVLPASTPVLTAAHSTSRAPTHLPRLAPELLGLVGAIRIKDTASIAKKFVTRAGQASQDYAQGVSSAGQDWQANTLAAEGNYEQGVTASIADKRFGKGVNASGAQKYTDNATKLGPQRFQSGVANAENAYARGVQPHLDAMKSLDLPPRGPKGSAQNQQRAQVVAARNRAIKLGK